MNLFRYSLSPLGQLLTGSQSSLLSLRDLPLAPPYCVYTTTNTISTTPRSRSWLSVTYYPKFRNKFEVRWPNPADPYSLQDNMGRVLRSDAEALRAPRVWPAYSRNGGAHEIVVTSPASTGAVTVAQPAIEQVQLGGPGGFDRYHGNLVAAYTDVELDAFLRGFGSIVATLNDLPGEEEIRLKRHEDQLVVAWQTGQALNSLSVGYRSEPQSFNLTLWGATWRDDLASLSRRLFKVAPVTVQLPPCVNGFPNTQVPEVTNAIQQLIHRLRNGADNNFAGSLPFQLPP